MRTLSWAWGRPAYRCDTPRAGELRRQRRGTRLLTDAWVGVLPFLRAVSPHWISPDRRLPHQFRFRLVSVTAPLQLPWSISVFVACCFPRGQLRRADPLPFDSGVFRRLIPGTFLTISSEEESAS